MNRARRMGVAASQFEIRTDSACCTFPSRSPRSTRTITSGFVLVLEDTSDMLRAQKAAAWHEIARRIAHEMKNPLTPIALCAERIVRQLDRSLGAGRIGFAGVLGDHLLGSGVREDAGR